MARVGRVWSGAPGDRFRHLASRCLSTKFFSVEGTAPHGSSNLDYVVGESVNHAIDLQRVRPGEPIEIPYEVTVNSSMRDFWLSAFHSNDRINTSTPFARNLGFQDAVLPFSMILFLAGSMTHADAAKVQVGYHNAIYHWPAFSGDTFTRTFHIKSRRTTSDGENSIFTFNCVLKNQRGRVVFTTDKTMLFPFKLNGPDELASATPAVAMGGAKEDLKKHIIESASKIGPLGSQSLTALRPGQLILHSLCRPLSATQCMQLSSLARLTHERHFNHHVYNIDEIYIPGGLVLGLTASASARDLHEVLHEDVLQCSYINNLHPGDTVGAISFVKAMEENITGDMEMLTIRTVGVKNIDVQRELQGMALPVRLFTESVKRPRDYEQLCKEECPILSNRIVACLERRILRQTPKAEAFLL